jgi:hypothetical protein
LRRILLVHEPLRDPFFMNGDIPANLKNIDSLPLDGGGLGRG